MYVLFPFIFKKLTGHEDDTWREFLDVKITNYLLKKEVLKIKLI